MKPFALFCAAAAALMLSGCDVPVDEKLVSTAPAASFQFSEAKSAASVCGQLAPDWVSVSIALKRDGFIETQDPRLVAIQQGQRAVILEKPGTDVIVLIGASDNEGACFVGAKGMTPQQSFELAQPWVRKFNAQTNAERGQGLAKNAVQAWGSIDKNRDVYIAAFKTWDLLDAPGAAARLFYVKR